MYSRGELEEQEKGLKVLRYVFLPILFVSLLIGYFKNNSLKYIEKKYRKVNESNFSGIVYKKRAEGEGREPHYFFLNSGKRISVNYILYDRIDIGDSVVKKYKSDSIYYYKKKGEVIIEDENQYFREKYLDKLNEK